MTDWVYAQADPAEELAQLHFFSMKKRQPDGDIEFIITVREYAERGLSRALAPSPRRREPNRLGPIVAQPLAANSRPWGRLFARSI